MATKTLTLINSKVTLESSSLDVVKTKTIYPGYGSLEGIPNHSKINSAKVSCTWYTGNDTGMGDLAVYLNGKNIVEEETGYSAITSSATVTSDEFKSTLKNAGKPDSIEVKYHAFIVREFFITNFNIFYDFVYPTYQINADIKSDGVTNTTPGRIVVVTDSGYTSFTLNSKFDVDQTSKKYGIRAEPYYGFKFSKWEDGDTSNIKTWTISDGNINSHTT